METSLPQSILSIKLERSSERLTSLGGQVVLEELARARKVWEEVDRVLEDLKSGRVALVTRTRWVPDRRL